MAVRNEAFRAIVATFRANAERSGLGASRAGPRRLGLGCPVQGADALFLAGRRNLIMGAFEFGRVTPTPRDARNDHHAGTGKTEGEDGCQEREQATRPADHICRLRGAERGDHELARVGYV